MSNRRDSRHEEATRDAEPDKPDGPDGPKRGRAPTTPILDEVSKPLPILGSLPSLEPILSEPTTEVPALTEEAPSRSGQLLAAVGSGDVAKIVQLLRAAARFFVTVTVFVVPIVFDPRTVDAFNLAKLTALCVLILVAAGLWMSAVVLERPRRRRGIGPTLPRSWIVRLSLLLLAITSLATVLSSTRALSFFGLYHRYEGLVSLGLYVGFLLLVVALYRRRPDALRELVAALGAAAVVVSFYIVLQRLGIDFERWQQVTGRAPEFPIGNLGNSALSGSFLGIAVPFVVYLAVSAASWARRIAWASAGSLVLLALWFTQNRSGIIAAVFGVLAMALFAILRMPARQKVAMVGGAFLVLGLAPLVVPGIVGPRAPAGLSIARTETIRYRVHMWDAAWRMTIERPVLGWGPETFYGNYPRFRSPVEAREQGLSITDKPHNIFLGWATTTGLVGLLTYLTLVGSALWLLAAGLGRLEGRRRSLARCFGAGLVAYLAQGMYSIDVPPLALMGWIGLAGMAVLLEPGRRERDEDAATDDAGGADGIDISDITGEGEADPERVEPVSRRTAQRGDLVACSAVGIALIVLLTLGVRPLRADHVAWAAEQRGPAGWSAETMRLYEKAISLHPFEPAYRGLAAFYLERVAGIQAAPFRGEEALLRAAELYEQANGLQPDNIYFMINSARVYARLGTADVKYYAEGDRWLGRAVTQDPLDPQLHDLYADLLRQWAPRVASVPVRDEIRRRAETQAMIAGQLRAGRVVP